MTLQALLASFWISVLIQNHFALEQWVEKRLFKQMDRLVHQYPHVEGAGGNEESLQIWLVRTGSS